MTGILETDPFNVDGTILHIGAGQCSELAEYLATSASHIVLVEPNLGDARILKQQARGDKRVKVITAAVSGEDGKATLYLCNDERFNGLHPPKMFNRQLPGLRAVETLNVTTFSIASLVDKLALKKKKSNCLIIEAKGEETTILRDLKELIGHPVFKYIVMYASAYGQSDQAGETSSSLLTNLAEIGYRVEEVALHEQGYLVHSATIDSSWEANKELQERLAMTEDSLKNKAAELEHIADKLTESQDRLESLEKQGASQKELVSKIKKELTNEAKQVEDYLNIIAYLNGWDSLPGMHRWAISPDFGLYIIDHLENNNYDLIIEFGSGTSTVLIAKVLDKINRIKESESGAVQVAFEHLERFYFQTGRLLQKAGLEDRVQLELAPLELYSAPNGNEYMYYDCEGKIASLAKIMDSENLKALVLVDGPPGSTGKHARYPALPIFLDHFKKAKLCILMDDYVRKEEKEIAKLWMKDLESSKKKLVIEEMKLDKGGVLISAE